MTPWNRVGRRAAGAYLLTFMACLVGYLALPVTIVRPSTAHADGLSLVMLRALYAFDPPVNVFPSFHAAVAAILWRLRPTSRFMSAAVSVWTVALCAACVLTKQHYVLDVTAGLGVGGIAATVVDIAWTRIAQPASPTRYTVRPVGSETAE